VAKAEGVLVRAICLPAFNERDNLVPLLDEISEAVSILDGRFVVIVADDGSTDGTTEMLKGRSFSGFDLVVAHSRVRVGKASALNNAIQCALSRNASQIVMMDADGQDDPRYLKNMFEELSSGADLVNGRRTNRAHGKSKRVSSRLFNATVRRLTNIQMWDINSGFKGLSERSAVALLPYLYGELHRVIVVIAVWLGLSVNDIKVHNRPRTSGKSKYGLARGWRGLFDLITIQFLRRYHSRPGHFFSGIGAFLLATGFVVFVLGFFPYINGDAFPPGSYFPWIGFSAMAFGVVFISFGFISELMLFLSKNPLTSVVSIHESQSSNKR
jgi:glycosyltransferase involved in cell wall biosynthesis